MMNKAREGRPYQPHRRDWPGFLRRVIPDAVWQAVNRQVQPSGDPRVRWSPKYVLLCWVVMGWSVQDQLSERFREGCELLEQWYARRRRCGSTYQGLVTATQRVGVGTFTALWDALRPTLPRRVGSSWTWHGWTVFAVDGSRIDAPRTRRNEKALGKSARDKSHPQWWVTRMIHLPTKLMWDWCQGPGKSSERAHLRLMLPTLPPASLVVADIGFGGFDLLSLLESRGVSFLVRCGGCNTLLVEHTRQKIERARDVRYVYLWPQNRRRKKPLRLRLIIVKKKKRPVYLLTNVLESTRLSRCTAGEFYRARWGIEVEYRGLKQTMNRRKVLARTFPSGAMELAANLLAMALLLLHAAMVLGARTDRCSLAKALRAIRAAIEALRHEAFDHDLMGALAKVIGDDYQRKSNKRARDWPHKKNESPPGPPNWRILSENEKVEIKRTIQAWEAKVA